MLTVSTLLFSEQAAIEKVKSAEDAWNSRCPKIVSKCLSKDSVWQDGEITLQGRGEIISFLVAKWNTEFHYRHINELWSYHKNRIAVRFAYEWRTIHNKWFRSFGNENWEFDESGLLAKRIASVNETEIDPCERLLSWPFGPRPDTYPALSELKL